MKEYLFLYPIKEYVDSCIVNRTTGFDKNYSLINNLIDARYRLKGYCINWLLFSLDEDNQKPDFSLVSPYFEIRENDRILNGGVSFKKHCNNRVYPNPNFVLDQLPNHDRLVLGGFHQSDCVDRMARASYERGVTTFVDEDTTDNFFRGISLGLDLPLTRKRWTLKDLGIPYSLMEDTKKIRKNKPWLTQT